MAVLRCIRSSKGILMTTQNILNAAMALPDSERMQVIEVLLTTFDGSAENPNDVAAGWRETARACANHDRSSH